MGQTIELSKGTEASEMWEALPGDNRSQIAEAWESQGAGIFGVFYRHANEDEAHLVLETCETAEELVGFVWRTWGKGLVVGVGTWE